jgi:uncharacterized protein YbjT (DUF2867 family)
MKVAVTGATGFTGRRVVRELIARGLDVAALVRPKGGAPAEGRLEGQPRLRVVEGDMGDAARLRTLLQGCDAFVHVASLGFGHASAVVGAVEECGVKRSVFFSSTSLFTRLPAASKSVRAEAEDRVRSLRSDWTILRPTMIYGDAGDRNLSRLIRFLARSPVVPLPGGGRALIQPVHVDDLARGAVDALLSDAARRREYDLPGANASSLREVVEHVARLVARRPWIVPLPLAPAALAAALWSWTGLPPRIRREQVLRLGEDKAFSFDAARRDFAYAPRGWREGLAAEVDLLRHQGLIA